MQQETVSVLRSSREYQPFYCVSLQGSGKEVKLTVNLNIFEVIVCIFWGTRVWLKVFLHSSVIAASARTALIFHFTVVSKIINSSRLIIPFFGFGPFVVSCFGEDQLVGQVYSVALQTWVKVTNGRWERGNQQLGLGPGAPFAVTDHRKIPAEFDSILEKQILQEREKNGLPPPPDTWSSRGNFPVNICTLISVLRKTKMEMYLCF